VKLGEALIKAGHITRGQLQQALDRQRIFGGRIDTTIVELRFMSDEQLTAFLGRFLRLPVVTSEMIDSIPEEVIRILNKKTVGDYMLLPFKLERQRLHVAMLNPRSIADTDNLRFTTGYEIIPYIITELRLLHSLEKYYGIKHEARFINLKEGFGPAVSDEDISTKIEMSESRFDETGKNDGNGAGRSRTGSEAAGGLVKTKGPGSIEALLLNTIYTAKLLYKQQGLSPEDSAVEDEVLADWERLSRKLKQKG
jgi:hypothetical protein